MDQHLVQKIKIINVTVTLTDVDTSFFTPFYDRKLWPEL